LDLVRSIGTKEEKRRINEPDVLELQVSLGGHPEAVLHGGAVRHRQRADVLGEPIRKHLSGPSGEMQNGRLAESRCLGLIRDGPQLVVHEAGAQQQLALCLAQREHQALGSFAGEPIGDGRGRQRAPRRPHVGDARPQLRLHKVSVLRNKLLQLHLHAAAAPRKLFEREQRVVKRGVERVLRHVLHKLNALLVVERINFVHVLRLGEREGPLVAASHHAALQQRLVMHRMVRLWRSGARRHCVILFVASEHLRENV
jgi:hypothetical protein